jgi:CRP-like cAMP-binding protein
VDVFQEAEMLRRVPTFNKLDPAKLKLLAFTSRALSFRPGDALVLVGEPSDSIYLILDGEVEVMGSTLQGEFVVKAFGANQMIGEMGVLTNTPRSATVRARNNVRALRISADVFRRLVSENQEVALDVIRQLCERLAHATRTMEMLEERVQHLEAKLDGQGGVA